MSNLTKGIILVVAIVAIGFGLVVWKNKVGGSAHAMSFNSMTRPEVELLLSDVAKTNPAALKRLNEDPEMKKQQVDNLKQLLAFASQAQKDGLTDEPSNRQELDSIRAEVLAVNYDREINKDKGPMPPFGFVSEEQIAAFWSGQRAEAPSGFMDKVKSALGMGEHVDTRAPEDEFNDFLNAKIAIMKAGSPEMQDREISEEEKTQARDLFAKIRIYETEFEQKAAKGELDKTFVDKAYLQVKLQQAQFLARLYSEKVAEQIKVTDEEVAKYVSEHPEYDPAAKRTVAQGILDRAKAGEDFVALANEFTQDPGNKGPDGKPQGGIYKDVPKGRMVAPFEAAALALEPGQIAPELVETDFGFHIVKLERKLGPSTNKEAKPAAGAPPTTGDTYDVRHILISTGIKDADKPNARELPVKEYVKNKLETEKEKALLDKIIADNNVQVPDDFSVPEITEEQLNEARQKQQMQQMPPGGPQPGQPGPPPPSVKPEGPPAGKPAAPPKK